MKFKPLGDRVVIKALEEGESQVGGIIIPDTAKEKPSKGEVVAVGPGRRKKTGEHIPMDGTVRAGSSAVNQAPITGESRLVEKEPGAEVFAGSIN